jgi:predicted MFS family arabinose efflux permease
MATSFGQLALARMGVGIGEAATGPAGQSVLSDLFPPARRAAALSTLAVGAPLGMMAAFALGGWLERKVGWRATLVCVGLPGLALALLTRLTLAEPRRGGADRGMDETLYGARATLAYLWSLRSFRHLTLGAALTVFTGWAFVVWSPAYLIRLHGMDTARIGAWLGLASGVGGASGMLLAGLAAERLGRRDPRWLLRVPSLTSLLALPFGVLFVTLDATAAAVPMFFGIMLFGPAMLGPVMTVTQGLAKIRMRALAAALVTLTFNLIGTGMGPLAVGVLSDLLAPRFGTASLRYALLLAAAASPVAAIHFFLGAQHLPADLARAGGDPAVR